MSTKPVQKFSKMVQSHRFVECFELDNKIRLLQFFYVAIWKPNNCHFPAKSTEIPTIETFMTINHAAALELPRTRAVNGDAGLQNFNIDSNV